MDIEAILEMYEDDYNPSSTVPGPRNMADGGRIGFKGGYRVEDMTSAEIKSAQGNARKKGYSSKLGSESFTEFLANEYRSKAEQQKDFEKLKQKNLKEYQSKFSPEAISQKTGSLTKKEKLILYKSYDNIFKEEFDRLLNEGELFSKSDLNRSIINRIADENPTIDLTKGTGLDKIPGGGNEESKTLFENIDKKFTKKQKANFTTNTNALAYTKNQDRLLQALLSGNTDFDDLAEELGFNEGRLKGNLNKLMRNLAYTEKSKQPLFFKKYSQEELENARNAVFNSPTLESAYQRTALQSILASTVEGSKQRKDALNKYKEFNKFKAVMKENGIDPKLVAMDHAASYRAIKNGNVKNFLAMTPIMSDINAIKSTFDRRSQLNLRRMQDAITSGDNASYKKFLKNQKELEGVWKTMTGDQSSLGKIRIGATGKKKGVTKIFDYGATSILDKNKDLLNELGDNLVIRENIVKASTKGNLDEVSRIMFEGSEAEKPRASKLPESFKNLNKPEMFKTENQIRTLLADLGCPKSLQKASGGRIKYSTGSSCPVKGEKKLNKLLFKGGGTTTERNLVQKIISGGGKMALSMLNPKELIKLKNLVGPGALGIMGAYEVGSITDDVLRLNKPLDEALAGNWLTKSFLPYSEEFAKQKNLLQSGQLTGDQKEYALEMMKMENFIKEGQRIEGLEANKLVEGTLDDDFTFTSDKDMNKAYSDLFGRFSRLKPYAYEQGITGRSLENEAAMNEYLDAQTARTGASKVFGGPQPMVNKAPRPKNMTRGPMTEKGKMNLDFSIPGYTPYDKTYTPTDEEILQIYRNQGIVPATFGGELQPGEGTRIRMGLASQEGNRSIYGSKFMEGGIASLNVNKK